MRHRSLAVAAASLAFAGAAQAAERPLPAGTEEASRLVTAEALRAPIRFLAHDLLEGRGPASRGDVLARLYLASTMEALGLEPGGPGGGWEQPVGLVSITAAPPKAWRFEAGAKGVDLAFSDDYIAASGVQAPAAM